VTIWACFHPLAITRISGFKFGPITHSTLRSFNNETYRCVNVSLVSQEFAAVNAYAVRIFTNYFCVQHGARFRTPSALIKVAPGFQTNAEIYQYIYLFILWPVYLCWMLNKFIMIPPAVHVQSNYIINSVQHNLCLILNFKYINY
jgi:hypothetical protein